MLSSHLYVVGRLVVEEMCRRQSQWASSPMVGAARSRYMCLMLASNANSRQQVVRVNRRSHIRRMGPVRPWACLCDTLHSVSEKLVDQVLVPASRSAHS